MEQRKQFITMAEFAAQALEHDAKWIPKSYPERIKWLHDCAKMMRENGSQSLIGEPIS
jgi:hypothetical protein